MEEEKTTYSLSGDSEEKKSGEAFVASDNKESDFSFDDLDESPLSFLSRKTVSLIIGILVVALLVPFLIFSFSRSKTKPNSSAQNTGGKQVAQRKTTPTPTPNAAQKKKTPTFGGGLSQNTPNTTKGGLPLNDSSASVAGAKKYIDPTFGYSVVIPGNWEAFRRAGSGNAYQVAFRPVGSLDAPFTIGAQPGAIETNWINANFGTNYPRSNTQVAGKSAISVHATSYISYYTHDNSYTYEISEALGKPEYQSIYSAILSSLTFSK